MGSNGRDRLSDLLLPFHDGNYFSEDELKQTLNQIAPSETGAYEELLHCLVFPDSNISRSVLELVLSTSESRDVLGSWLVQNLPAVPDHFSTSSTAISALKNLSHSIPFIHPFEREAYLKLSNYRVQVEYSTSVIEALIRFINTSSISSLDVDGCIPLEEDGFVIKNKQSQRSRKNTRTRPQIPFDSNLTKACEFLNISVPDTPSQARNDFHALMQGLRTPFMYYLSLLQEPAVEFTIRQGFVQRPTEFEEFNSQKEAKRSVLEDKPQDDAQDIPSAYPMVQPMKAALYFESADGFGEWRILISTRADRNLREARRRDAKFFRIIVKKIKELSNGHFSDDNQKRLTGGLNTEVPIYEAKMTRDSRLVYQIDCAPEYDSSIEKQLIKIFGIYTHAQLDKRLWESLSRQLMKRGVEYRERCIFRNAPSLAGDNVYGPACFPPMEKPAEDDQIVPSIPSENLEEIHSLLVLEKFVTFSQALLNSMIADLDIAHVFDVSPAEMEIIQHPYSCYVIGRSGTGKTTTMLFKMLGIQRAYEKQQSSMPKPRQVFVTQSRVLAVKVEEYFAKLLDSLATGNKTKEELAHIIKSKRQQQEESLVDIDDDQNWRPDLPSKYSELQDQHFPLFLTFDKLASLLEADISTNKHLDRSKGRLVNFDAFLASYWPHFSQTLKKGLDPALVYSELIGVIEGSEESLNHESRYLDKNAYENLSSRTQYAFATQREIIYGLFVLYLKYKKTHGDYDAADRTHRILRVFQSMGVPGKKIDYLYVDEAQDNLLIDALLLRSLTKNPDGMFWAGDTAQTISVGSSFRFNDLKAFLFRLEKRREDSFFKTGAPFMQEPPRSFHLTTNYRSHGGIVRCAHSVIELITNFWPYAIDILSRERGVVDGSKPVFFSGWDSSTVRYEQFLFGESGRPVEFGAQQCILVRNEASREELRSQVGEIGLILTLYESKGLEFDDVLLYKFFEDSSADLSQWRVVLNLLHEKSHIDISAPEFDNSRHAGICTELKFLYVAITRARKNLWIVDCSEKSEPLRIFWKERDEVQCCTPGTDIPRLAVSSSPKEWEKTGRTLFTNKRFVQAMHCFERAGLDREAVVSRAYFLREQARTTTPTTSKQSSRQYQQAFYNAAEAFLQCSESAINPKEKNTYLRNAGDCYEKAEEDFKAAEVYNHAQEFTKAAKLYRKTAKFDDAVAVVTAHREKIDGEVAENIIDIAKLFYFKNGELKKASKLFDSVDEQLEYLEDFDLDVSRAALFEELGKYYDAAKIHLYEGRTLDAIPLFLKDNTNVASLHCGRDCILRGLWENVSFGMKISERLTEVEKHLNYASSLKDVGVATDELSIFQCLKSRDLHTLRVLGTKFESQAIFTSALFCFDHAFSSIPNMYGMTSQDVSGFLKDFLLFCRTLYRIAVTPNPCQDEKICKLFSIMPSGKNYFLLPPGTFLYNELAGTRASVVPNEHGAVISEWDLSQGFKNSLLNRLKARIAAENDACKQARAFNPCLPFIISNGHCNRKSCPNEHLGTASLGQNWFQLRIRIHLQQILLIQGLRMVPINPNERVKQYRYWISSLFDALFPPLLRLGHFANLDITTIPEAPQALPILEGYCKEILFWRQHTARDPKLLTTAYQVVRIIFYFNRLQALPRIIGSPLSNLLRTVPEYSRKEGSNFSFILPRLVYALAGNQSQGIECGILSLKHVLERFLPIDANTIFDLIDIICGSLILLRKNGILHNVTLPLSQVKNLLRIVKLDTGMKFLNINTLINMFTTSCKQLLETFVVRPQQLAQFLYERSDLFTLGAHRNIFLSRLCRAICLVGYNVNNEMLRTEILSSFKVLRQIKQPQNLLKDYAFARHWSDVARTIPRLIPDSNLDEMIQLYHTSEAMNARPPPRGIRRVIYKNVADIPKYLEGSSSFSNLRADAPAFVPKPTTDESGIEPEGEVEEPEVDNSEIVNSAPSAEPITITEVPDDIHAPSEEQQTNATILFQRLYRRRLRDRKSSDHLQGVLSCFQECMTESAKMEWPEKSYYCLLFLGPLPHVHVCLNAAYSWVMTNKKRNKERFKFAEHQELEDMQKRLTEQKKIIDEIRRLQKALNPTSPLHRKRDIEELKKLVLQVKEMLGRVAPNVAQNVEEDMQRAIKGIVAVKQSPKLKAKPDLNVDDEFVGEEYDDFGYDDSGSRYVHHGATASHFNQVEGLVAPSVAQNVEEDMQRAIKGTVAVKQPPKPHWQTKPARNVDDEFVGEEYDSKYRRYVHQGVTASEQANLNILDRFDRYLEFEGNVVSLL